jgi:hypothetical protein
MKTVGRYIAIVTFLAFGAPAPTFAASCAPAAAQADAFKTSANPAYPNFCDIPAKPTDIRPTPALKAAVVRTRFAGAEVVRESGPDTFSLTGTEPFAESGRQEGAPPPAVTTPGGLNTEAFALQAQAKVTPPRRRRH